MPSHIDARGGIRRASSRSCAVSRSSDHPPRRLRDAPLMRTEASKQAGSAAALAGGRVSAEARASPVDAGPRPTRSAPAVTRRGRWHCAQRRGADSRHTSHFPPSFTSETSDEMSCSSPAIQSTMPMARLSVASSARLTRRLEGFLHQRLELLLVDGDLQIPPVMATTAVVASLLFSFTSRLAQPASFSRSSLRSAAVRPSVPESPLRCLLLKFNCLAISSSRAAHA